MHTPTITTRAPAGAPSIICWITPGMPTHSKITDTALLADPMTRDTCRPAISEEGEPLRKVFPWLDERRNWMLARRPIPRHRPIGISPKQTAPWAGVSHKYG